MDNLIKAPPAGWEHELERLLLNAQRDNWLHKAYICSPCRADTAEGLLSNMRRARFYMYYAHKEMRVRARAPHAYLPTILTDAKPAERSLALRFGLGLMELSDRCFVCGDRITSGMRGEIEKAAELGCPICVFNPDLLTEVRKIITRKGCNKCLATYDDRHPLLGMGTGELVA